MRRVLTIAALFTAVQISAPAVIVDRIAIRVGNRVITASEIELRVRLAAFQNHAPVELTPAKLKEAAQSLVEQRLIRREMEIGHYPQLDAAGRAELLPDYVKEWFGSDAGAMGAELLRYGLKPADLEEDLARQADLLRFLALRFRVDEDSNKGNAELDAWLREQRSRNVIQYLDPELAP
jgi:hypothetical protein